MLGLKCTLNYIDTWREINTWLREKRQDDESSNRTAWLQAELILWGKNKIQPIPPKCNVRVVPSSGLQFCWLPAAVSALQTAHSLGPGVPRACSGLSGTTMPRQNPQAGPGEPLSPLGSPAHAPGSTKHRKLGWAAQRHPHTRVYKALEPCHLLHVYHVLLSPKRQQSLGSEVSAITAGDSPAAAAAPEQPGARSVSSITTWWTRAALLRPRSSPASTRDNPCIHQRGNCCVGVRITLLLSTLPLQPHIQGTTKRHTKNSSMG